MMSLGGNNVSRQVFYSLCPSVLGEGFRWSLVGKCSGSVSGWCSSNGSRLGPDRKLFVMQILVGLYMKLSSLVAVILVGLRYKLFINCRLGFGVYFDWLKDDLKPYLTLCSPGFFCKHSSV